MFLRVLAVLALALATEPAKYLIVSAPKLHKVMYIKMTPGEELRAVPLIDSGVTSPQGLAVDQKRQMLYVADPDLRKILSYELRFVNGVLMTEGAPRVAAQNVEARWCAVDGVGNLFFTDELTNLIQRVNVEDLQGSTAGTPQIIYDGAVVTEVNRPGGIAVDNFHVFWSNKEVGTQVGSVVKGLEQPGASPTSVAQIAKNTVKSYGVCLSQNNVYYTDSQKFLFGVKKNGGAIATVSDKLVGPRGCAYDGDGTVYVSDKTAGAIFSFPGNMHSLSPATLTKVTDFDDAFGLVVVQQNQNHCAAVVLLLTVLNMMW